MDMHNGTADDQVLIVGGGFGALAAAVALQKIGVKSIVFERSRNARAEGFSIGTFTNGWRALDELGAGPGLRAEHIKLDGIRFTNPKGSIITEFKLKDCQPPSYRPEHEMRVVMRESIPRHLSGLLPPDSVRYDSNVVDVTADNAGATVTLEGGQKFYGRFVVLADGVHSKTAAKYHKAKSEFQNVVGWRAVTEMPADGPPEPVAQFAQGGEGVRIGLLPAKYDPERRKMLWYWFIAHAANGNEAYFHQTPEEQKKFMQSKIAGWTVGMPSPFVDVVAANKPEDIKLSKIYQRRVVAGKPWFDGCITGVGDAVHATTPFLAQGGSMALESGVEVGVFINNAMERAGVTKLAQLSAADIRAALREYEVERSHRVSYIIRKSRAFGSTFMRRNWLVELLIGLLTRLGVFQVLPQPASSTFLDHADWQPHGSLSPPSATKGGKSAAAEE